MWIFGGGSWHVTENDRKWPLSRKDLTIWEPSCERIWFKFTSSLQYWLKFLWRISELKYLLWIFHNDESKLYVLRTRRETVKFQVSNFPTQRWEFFLRRTSSLQQVLLVWMQKEWMKNIQPFFRNHKVKWKKSVLSDTEC